MDEKKKLSDLVAELTQYCERLSGKEKEDIKHILIQLRSFSDQFIDFKMILNGLSDQFYITDAAEKTLFVNKAYCKAASLAPEQLIGKTIRTIVEKDHYFQNPIIPKVIEKKKKLQEIAQVQTQKEPVCVIGTPIFNEEGELSYVVSNDYRPEDISGLQYHFARFSEQKELLKKTAEVDYYRQHLSSGKTYLFSDSKMTELVNLVQTISNTDVTVLITGESGTGKEVIADLLHQYSSRSEKPFIKVNCTAIPETLMESELFGYEKGAFTGADKNGKIGMMELADKGTLFLDEIGDIPLSLQAKLLRAIQEKQIRRLGGTKEIDIDIRILAATNRDLKLEVSEGRFREDLYYRLNVIPIHIPALRKRPEDIRNLTFQFLEEFNRRYHKQISLDEDALICMQNYSWPGNIRELKNVMERLVVTHNSGNIDQHSMENLLGIISDRTNTLNVPSPAITDLNLKNARENLEIEYIKAALDQYISKRKAAKALGIDHSTLVLKCQRYGLSALPKE